MYVFMYFFVVGTVKILTGQITSKSLSITPQKLKAGARPVKMCEQQAHRLQK